MPLFHGLVIFRWKTSPTWIKKVLNNSNSTRTRTRTRTRTTLIRRRHLPYPYILLQQEDIFHIHIFFSNKKTYSSPKRRHLLCPYSIYHVSRAHTCLQSTHIESIRTRHGQNLKNWRFWLFLWIEGWPLGCQILSSLIVLKGFRASENIDFVEFQTLKNEMSKMVILVIS